MKLKYLLYIMILGFSLIACSEDNSFTGEESTGYEKITVCINLQQDLQITNSTTRATAPMPLENANKMYNFYLLHYDAEGQLVKADTKYVELNSAGVLEIDYNATLTNTGNPKGTICLVANLGTENAPTEWSAFLVDLQKQELLNLPLNSDGLYNDQMYMLGYYEGNLTNGMSLNILMGRMAACMNITITSDFTNDYTISTEVKNAVSNTHFFPVPEGYREEDNISAVTYKNFTDTNAGIVNNQKSLILYYYTGENISPLADKRTSITITAKRLNTTKKYTIELGADAPGTNNRNYSIYRNNNYTFNIHLKN